MLKLGDLPPSRHLISTFEDFILLSVGCISESLPLGTKFALFLTDSLILYNVSVRLATVLSHPFSYTLTGSFLVHELVY